MFGWNIKIDPRFGDVERRARKASFRSLGHAAGYLRKVAANSIRRRKRPSPPGRPPHTPTGKMKRLFRYSVDRTWQTAIIGPIPGVPSAGTIWNLHEHGGVARKRFKGLRQVRYRVGHWAPIRTDAAGKVVWIQLKTEAQIEQANRTRELANRLRENESRKERRYPPRPFMGPTLEKNRDKLPAFWRDTVR